MRMKATAVAPSNIAFIKYWGKKDPALRLPANGSISMNLSHLLTTTSVEFSSHYKDDAVIIDAVEQTETPRQRVVSHLNRIRERAGISEYAHIVSKNNFPANTGLSSSASGFAALTVAAAAAAGLSLSEKELSILARQGSGSACRSIPSGFVEWIDGNTSETSFAQSLYPPEYWDITDVIVVLSAEKKDISTTEGQKNVLANPFFQTRLQHMKEKIHQIKQIFRRKDFTALGEITESETLELLAIKMTSRPPIIVIKPQTLYLIQLVKRWRRDGLEAYFSVNTGQNVHIIIRQKDTDALMKKLDSVKEIQQKIMNTPGVGTRIINEHLF